MPPRWKGRPLIRTSQAPGAPASAGDRRRILIAGVGVAAAYLVATHLGFLVAFVAEQITTVWAPTGIAQAALLLWGRRLWPAVWLAAFAANAGTDAPLWTAAMIAGCCWPRP